MRAERLLDRIYETLAASDTATHAAVRIRGAATAVLGKRLAPSTLPEQNGELWLAEQLGPDVRVAVDVGANVGDWSAAALAGFPRLEQLVAYEPGTVGVTLEQRLSGEPRATVVRQAVADRAGSITFHEDLADSKLSTAVDAARPGAVVPCVTLDEELDRLGIEHVGFLKVDVEGLDLHVLRGACRALAEHRIDAVQYEYGPLWQDAGSTLRAADELLRRAGYRHLLLTPSGLREFPVRRVSELFMYANFVGLLPEVAARFEGSITPVW